MSNNSTTSSSSTSGASSDLPTKVKKALTVVKSFIRRKDRAIPYERLSESPYVTSLNDRVAAQHILNQQNQIDRREKVLNWLFNKRYHD